MKRYLLFSGSDYYPAGGWDDFINSFNTLIEARAAGEESNKEDKDWKWFHIVDLKTGRRIDG